MSETSGFRIQTARLQPPVRFGASVRDEEQDRDGDVIKEILRRIPMAKPVPVRLPAQARWPQQNG